MVPALLLGVAFLWECAHAAAAAAAAAAVVPAVPPPPPAAAAVVVPAVPPTPPAAAAVVVPAVPPPSAAAAAAAAAVVPAVPPPPSVHGCYPPYTQGKAYSISDWVSASTTTTTDVSYVACPPGQGNCPLNGWRQEGGITTSATHNYQCHSDIWCSNSGYAPGSVYSNVAWTKEMVVCSVSEW